MQDKFLFGCLLFVALFVAACSGSKTASTYKPTGVSAAMIRLLSGTWEVVGMTVDGKSVSMPPKQAAEISFKDGKMLLTALGKKESSPFTVKDKMIVNPANLTERPLQIASITRTDLVLNFVSNTGKPVEVVFLHK
jgi:hypothetical protein